MRPFLLVAHRWVALAATLFILIVAATGSALVFEGAMDRALYPNLWRVAPGTARLPLDTIIANARRAVPGPAAGITLATAPDRADVVQVGANQVFVNPYTGALLGTRSIAEWNATLPRRLHVLHVQLMTGRVGSEIVGAVTVIALLLVLTGIYLWWADKQWRINWSASWKRIVFDLHHTLGIAASVVLLAITGSGVIMHYRTLNDAIAKLDRTAPPQIPDQAAAPTGAEPLALDSLERIAMAALPGARVMFASMSPRATDPIAFALRFPEDHTPGGRSRVFIDRYRGTVLLATSTRTAPPGTRILNVMRSVHTGDVFGKPSEAVWLLASLVMLSQSVTGVMMWWNGRKGRAARNRRAASGGQLPAADAAPRVAVR